MNAASSAPAPRRGGRRFLLAVGLTLAVYAVFNVALGIAIRTRGRSVYRVFLSETEHGAPAARVLVLGNSLIQAGFDPGSFAGALPPSAHATPAQFLNAGLGNTSTLTHDVILHDLLPRAGQAQYLVYGFFDTQLTDSFSCDWGEMLTNRALPYRFPDVTAQICAPGDPWTLWRLRILSAIPVLSDRAAVWGWVNTPRRRVEAFGLRSVPAVNRFGRTEDFALLGASETGEFAARVGALADRRAPFASTVAEMFRLARRDRSLACCLVEMPMRPAHRERFYSAPQWTRYRQHLQALAAAAGVAYLRAEDWVDDSQFSDSIHLDERGAAVFSARLAHELPPLQPLPPR